MVKDKESQPGRGKTKAKTIREARAFLPVPILVQRLAKGAPVCVPLPRNPFTFEDPTVRQAGTDIR